MLIFIIKHLIISLLAITIDCQNFDFNVNIPTPNWFRNVSGYMVLPCFYKVCYNENHVGCFQPQAMELIPILPPVGVCPHSPSFIQLKFQVYLKNDTKKALPVEAIPYNSRLGICTHGYTPSSNSSFTQMMKDTLLKVPDVDACLLPDWDRGAKNGAYPGSFTIPVEAAVLAARNLQIVGRMVAVALHRISVARRLKFEDMYYYGHSYGAQMAHHVSYWLDKRYNKTIHRMTLADPGGPFFLGHPERAVNKADADQVDCIHTSMFYSLGVPHYVGYYQNVCHRDFYPNGGGDRLIAQPGCEGSYISWCSHFKALFDIDAAVGNCTYRAKRCHFLANFDKQNCTENGVTLGYISKYDTDNYINHQQGIYHVTIPKNPYVCPEDEKKIIRKND